jgi:hypothetical protein
MPDIEITHDFGLDDLAETFSHSFRMASNLEYKDVVDFFARIDELIGSWDFTKLVAKRFVDELGKMEAGE